VRTLACAFCLAASAALSGCATSPGATTTVRTEGNVAAGARLVAPLIVADGSDLELQGPELTPEARARFQEERAARIAQRARADVIKLSDSGLAEGCIKMGIVIPVVGLLACPIGVLGTVMTAAMVNGLAHAGKYAVASVEEPALRLSPVQAERIAAALTDQTIGTALVERAIHAAPADFAHAAQAESLLVVRMKAALICEADNAPAICLVAEARGFLGDGLALAPTDHVFLHGPLEQLSGDDAHLRRKIDQGMDLLAKSIVAAYTGGVPSPDTKPAPAPAPRPVAPEARAELRKLTEVENSVFPKAFSGSCLSGGC